MGDVCRDHRKHLVAVAVDPVIYNKTAAAMVAVADLKTVVEVKTGDRVEIRKSGNKARIIRINQDSFLETLRRKMSPL